jgi:hypothetical protein
MGTVRRVVVRLDAELTEQARGAVKVLRTRGEPQMTLGELVDRALGEYLDRAADEHNEGQGFPAVRSLPQGSQLRKGL